MKQTEIGLIPEDWEVKEISSIKDKLVVGFVGTCEKYYTTPANGIVMLRTGDLKESYIDFSNTKYVTKEFHTNNRKSQLHKNDILIARHGSNGHGVLFESNIAANSLNIVIFHPDEKLANPKYTVYQLDSTLVKNQVNTFSAGSTQDVINISQIAKLKIPFPSTLAEQQRIAKALSDVDALISTTEKLIQKKKNIKQGSMQELLTGKKRLLGFTKSSNYKQTEIGLIPEDWEVKSLGEIFEFRPNNTFTRDCLNDSKGKYQNVHYGDVLIKYPSILDCSKETIPFINEGINVKFSKYGIVEGDIIIADTAEDETVGKVVEVFNLGEKKIVSGLHTFLCRKITDDFAPKWLGYFMNQAIFHNQLLPFITGTKVSAISRTAIQNVKVLIPSKEEQTAIAKVLSSMDKEIETLNTKLEKYRNLKTAIMQQLLTGKIRL